MKQRPVNSSIYALFESAGAFLRAGHFVYTSRRHGNAYVNKDALYTDTTIVSEICQHLALCVEDFQIETVISPAVGAIILSQWTAYHLTNYYDDGRVVHAVYADKECGQFVLKRGFGKFVTGRRVAVVEDILNTGKSVRKVVELVRSSGGEVVVVAAICNRGGVTEADIGDVPRLISLADIRLDSWEANQCPLCQANVPVNTQYGKGSDFLKLKN